MKTWDEQGGAAFPCIGGDSGLHPDGGLSQRRWYAGLAMQALVRDNDKIHASLVAKRAFEIADAMLQEGEK